MKSKIHSLNKVAASCIVGLLAFLGAESASAVNLQSWDTKQAKAKLRFKVLSNFENLAVLDKETQLVWAASLSDGLTWENAVSYCYNLNISDRKGWRLPTIAELSSLIDSTQSNPALPLGHPFTSITGQPPAWSATTDVANTTKAFYIELGDGSVKTFDKASGFHAWCVRGGQGEQ